MTSQFLRREPAATVCFLSKRSNRNLHHSSNLSSMFFSELPPSPHVSKMAAGERFERPYPDSKSRVLPLDDPASSFQRYRFHAPHAQHRRFIQVVTQLSSITARTLHQLAVIPAALAIKLRSKLNFKTIEVNRLCVHNLVAARRIELPSQP